jgi:hypothetical protein
MRSDDDFEAFYQASYPRLVGTWPCARMGCNGKWPSWSPITPNRPHPRRLPLFAAGAAAPCPPRLGSRTPDRRHGRRPGRGAGTTRPADDAHAGAHPATPTDPAWRRFRQLRTELVRRQAGRHDSRGLGQRQGGGRPLSRSPQWRSGLASDDATTSPRRPRACGPCWPWMRRDTRSPASPRFPELRPSPHSRTGAAAPESGDRLPALG